MAAGPQESGSSTTPSSSTNSSLPQDPKRPASNERKHAPANLYPQNSGDDISFLDLIRSVKLEEFWTIQEKPCVRDALLAGITGGFLAGGGRAALGGRAGLVAAIPKAANWAVGAMVGTSIGAYEFCQYRRRLEIQGMQRVAEVIERKKVEKARRLKEEAEARRKAEEERMAEERRRQSRWWKIW
ncbi:MAG: hypothetical protein M1816_000851 [Peltula sp. TS41687]|nr:MAG: hypothetical protein M1816_000851 [Peltula sp. TS41687]